MDNSILKYCVQMCINRIKNKSFHVTNIFMGMFSFSLYDVQFLLFFPISTCFQHTNFFISGAAFSQLCFLKVLWSGKLRNHYTRWFFVENLISAHNLLNVTLISVFILAASLKQCETFHTVRIMMYSQNEILALVELFLDIFEQECFLFNGIQINLPIGKTVLDYTGKVFEASDLPLWWAQLGREST